MMEEMLQSIVDAFSDRDAAHNESYHRLVESFLNALEQGQIRTAQKTLSGWQVDERVKKGILLAFRIGQKEKVTLGPFSFIDKRNLMPRDFDMNDEVRIVPGAATVRRGAYVSKNVIVMSPAYVNIGAYIDEGTLVDSHVLVGSCAQIGKRVHISAGVQIGGVLEPVGALPVIIEDDCLLGGSSAIYEGAQIGAKAVIGAGVILTKSSKIFDLVNERIISADTDVLKIPAGAVVVPGARALTNEFGKAFGLSITTPLIIKYRDDKTDTKTALEDFLR